MTYKILYNSAVAMTGGQDAAGALPIPLSRSGLEADGIKRIIITHQPGTTGVSLPTTPRSGTGRLLEAQSVLAAVPASPRSSTISMRGPRERRLAAWQAGDPQTRVFINEAVCEGCGDWRRKSNCLSVQPPSRRVRPEDPDPPVLMQQGLFVLPGRLPAS